MKYNGRYVASSVEAMEEKINNERGLSLSRDTEPRGLLRNESRSLFNDGITRDG